MSVVAWDGFNVAADRQATNNGMRMRTSKLLVLKKGPVAAWTGGAAAGRLLARWYETGADPKEYPDIQKTDDWTRLIVFKGCRVLVYEQVPEPIVVKAPFMAWGSGRDFAMGAMAHGSSARQAVLIANRLNVDCGFGYDLVHIRDA